MLTGDVDVALRTEDLLAAWRLHLPDGRQRCRGCTEPGYGTPSAPWPCALYLYAEEAARTVASLPPTP